MEKAEKIKKKNKYDDNGNKRERKETSKKRLFPGRPISSNVEAVDEF
jgi:hypothetical protein